MSFRAFFREATRREDGSEFDPYPYQERLGREPWPDVLEIPTGLGKTAAVGVAWLYKRVAEDPDTPRRLVSCLPMRVLVEQTSECFRRWLRGLDLLGEPGEGKVSVNVLMGGEEDVRRPEWALYPAENAIIVGTQDMLLSRALMRGYGMSRYQWPVHFALLHNDAFWVFDEVQLMGPALSTSAQLEAFRRSRSPERPARSLWTSATLRPDWLQTVDFRPHAESLSALRLAPDDRERAAGRLGAAKRLREAPVRLDGDNAKGKARTYIDALADAVLTRHRPGGRTIVILNRVERAQALYRGLRASEPDMPALLLHARFRPAERQAIEAKLKEPAGDGGRIVVATQAIEAGVDISSSVLFTELAPWASMVQRFGRCNRYGECEDGADVFWIDIADDADEAAPYDDAMLAASRALVAPLDSAAADDLPAVEHEWPIGRVLRRKDFLELFNTDPDLSGFDIDVSPYIRDSGSPQVHVFWREFRNEPVGRSRPEREELCPASMGQIADYLNLKRNKEYRRFWSWDALMDAWRPGNRHTKLRPGQTLLLRAADGGYDPNAGFDASSKAEVSVVGSPGEDSTAESFDSDALTPIGRFLRLDAHLDHVADEATRLCDRLGLDGVDGRVLETAGRWHDVGKAHPAFQTALLDHADDGDAGPDVLWAKSSGRGRLDYRVIVDGEPVKRPYFRHELASMLAWLEHGPPDEDHDLVAYLIAAHHGRVRLGLRALPDERRAPEGRRFARGVWEGDALPPVPRDGEVLPATELHLDVMELGLGAQGPSWTERTQRLLRVEGPFRLAWLEALLRIADWRASRGEEVGRS